MTDEIIRWLRENGVAKKWNHEPLRDRIRERGTRTEWRAFARGAKAAAETPGHFRALLIRGLNDAAAFEWLVGDAPAERVVELPANTPSFRVPRADAFWERGAELVLRHGVPGLTPDQVQSVVLAICTCVDEMRGDPCEQ